ncbi:MAG: MazG nucleotide pyrophosphohydrolase domain-containing protein [Candidatus Woesearchaeota archaeon]
MNLKQLYQLVEQKYDIDQKSDNYSGSQRYIQGIVDEVKEIQKEIEQQNHVYLEDELGDILWDYLNVLKNLEKEGKIQANRVLKRAQEKYGQRIQAIQNNIPWKTIKDEQKAKLKQEQKIFKQG